MSTDTRTLVKAFRRALELAADEPVLSAWRGHFGSFPAGCCEMASQTLVRYLMEHNEKLFPYVIGMDWRVKTQDYGHVIVALNGDYIDLTLDQFPGYDDWIVAEPIESGGQLGTFLRTIRNRGGTFSTRKLTFDGIPDDALKLYDWLKATADSLLPETALPCSAPKPLSMEIPAKYRDRAMNGPSDNISHAPGKKKRQPMTHVGTITECYRPREVRLRETSTWWVSECGLRFRKTTGAAVGSGVWSADRLDLKSIREIKSGE